MCVSCEIYVDTLFHVLTAFLGYVTYQQHISKVVQSENKVYTSTFVSVPISCPI